MPFQYILANLLAQNDQAAGVLFLDGSGETVDLACAEFTPHQLRIVGAYLGIYLRQMQRILDEGDYGRPGATHIEQRELHIFAQPLPDGYYLVLVLRRPALVALARRSLEEAGRQLSRELFEQA